MQCNKLIPVFWITLTLSLGGLGFLRAQETEKKTNYRYYNPVVDEAFEKSYPTLPKAQFDPRQPPIDGNPRIPSRPNIPYRRTTTPQTPPTRSTATSGDKVQVVTVTKDAKGKDLYTLDYRNADIEDVVQDIAEITERNFLLDPKVKGTITIISPTPISKDAVWEVFLSVLKTWQFTVVESGPITKIVQMRDAASSPIKTSTRDTDTPVSESFMTRLYTLENVKAEDMANAIKPMIDKSGDVKAYKQTNTLIMTDTGANIRRIIDIIRMLDKEGAKEKLEVIPLMNADPQDVADKIRSLYQQKEEPTTRRVPIRRTRTTTPSSPTGIGEGEGPLAVSQVIPDTRTNSIIVVATERAFAKIRELVALIDVEIKDPKGNIHVYYLEHAKAEDLATVLANLVNGTGGSQNRTSTPVSTTVQGRRDIRQTAATRRQERIQQQVSGITAEFSEDLRITADANTNSLVITASHQEFEALKQVIKKLDIPRRQVFIEAVIMELAINNDRNLGVSLSGGATPGGNPVFGGTSFTSLNPLALDTAALAGLSGLNVAGVSKETVTLTLSDGTTTTVPAFSAVLQALETSTNVNILSTPNVLTTDNEEAEIIVGQNIPFVTESGRDSNNNPIIQVERQDVAITLRVTPFINESDFIRLEVFQEITEVIPNQDATIVLNQGPATTKRSTETTVVVKDSSTVVLGGLISDKNTVTEARVPWLGKIPVLGFFFKSSRRAVTKTNLIIFLTPFIIDTPSDFKQILVKKIQERNNFIKRNYGWIQRKQIQASLAHHQKALLDISKSLEKNPVDPALQSKGPLAASSTTGNGPDAQQPTLPKNDDAKPIYEQEVDVNDLLEEY